MSGTRDTKVISAGENDDSHVPNTSTEVRVATSSNRAPGAEQPTSGATTDETTTEIGDERYPVYLNESGAAFLQGTRPRFSFELSSEQKEAPQVIWVVLSQSPEGKPEQVQGNAAPVALLGDRGKSISSPNATPLKDHSSLCTNSLTDAYLHSGGSSSKQSNCKHGESLSSHRYRGP